MTGNAVVRLNQAVAVDMAYGPRAGLAMLAPLDEDPRLARHHRLAAVRAHLLELAGDLAAARAGYEEASPRTTGDPERRHLRARIARLTS
ncbi:hypothetical protein SAMN05421810_106341 [Amycolatopsis arida]|uniref:RNA polymerase sigma-70 factor, ECF subfamily n=1 Tax=Amycolatopsis arida TaxID=587909 RepID=A0A1I5XZJ3_9PSEU|nr:hypothetical protein CLV69_102281 [Amycolatopsis arida]SFQ37336.1 hypothetical protein SAMN05421810_106341 [Amycolatopsis arida]